MRAPSPGRHFARGPSAAGAPTPAVSGLAQQLAAIAVGQEAFPTARQRVEQRPAQLEEAGQSTPPVG
eukprot:494390-Lingulodinium_polyedra.AAC.1